MKFLIDKDNGKAYYSSAGKKSCIWGVVEIKPTLTETFYFYTKKEALAYASSDWRSLHSRDKKQTIIDVFKIDKNNFEEEESGLIYINDYNPTKTYLEIK